MNPPSSTASSSSQALVPPDATYGTVTDQIVSIPLARGFRWGWLFGFGLSLAVLQLGLISAAWLVWHGVGVWGINIPVAWGFAITNFVWWIGIGHAGTLISAILLLFRQRWRNSINRFAEAMTLFAVANAGLFPLMHLGRFWKFYYLLPYPNTMTTWPQWRSPLVWDVFAVMTYSLVSLLFWYVGLVPDLATMRDKSKRRWISMLAGIFALGWRGSARHWHRYQRLYLLLAGLATPLVVSVHSIVSFDFAVSILPGWHTTVYPPYFVAGAIYSGFAMVLMIAVPLRAAFRMRDLITPRHLDNMAKIMLVSGLIVLYGYVMENFTALYSGDTFEIANVYNRITGAYAGRYWFMIFCNVVVLQSLWFRAVRSRPVVLFVVATLINTGMWLERFIIVVSNLHHDYIPSSWGMFSGTFWDWTLLLGSLAFFSTLMFLFIRCLPMVSIFEVRELIHERRAEPSPQEVSSDSQTDSQPLLEGVIPDESLYGLMAEYQDADQVVHAARLGRDAGYRRMDAYVPFPVPELTEALGVTTTRLPYFVLAGAVIGGLGAYFMQYYSAVIGYPINVGGRPNHSWPSFIPITFELAVLGGSFFGLGGMLWRNRLPRLHHPVFNVPGFERATCDRFFLCIERRDPMFDRTTTFDFLEDSDPVRVFEVPN